MTTLVRPSPELLPEYVAALPGPARARRTAFVAASPALSRRHRTAAPTAAATPRGGALPRTGRARAGIAGTA